MEDVISISKLEVQARIGVTEEERATPQRLTITLHLAPSSGFDDLRDEVERTVDYAAVCQAIRDLAGTGERKLIETLAEEAAAALLGRFPLRSVGVEICKFILPDTEHVSVSLRRYRVPEQRIGFHA